MNQAFLKILTFIANKLKNLLILKKEYLQFVIFAKVLIQVLLVLFITKE
jgi:hypothetical protein